jgi:hypothetical protein
MLQDHEGVVGRSSGGMGEACEVPKLEVPRPNFITQGVSQRRDGVYEMRVSRVGFSPWPILGADRVV